MTRSMLSQILRRCCSSPWLRSLGVVAVGLALLSRWGPATARACGGPSYAHFAGLSPVRYTVGEIEHPDIWASWGNERRESLRFLYPFQQHDPARIGPLWRFSHESGAQFSAPSPSALDQALAAGDWNAAKTAAQALIDGLYALPPVPAARHRALLERALEVIELHPHLGAVPPKAARDYFAQTNRASWPALLVRAHQARRGGASSNIATHPRAATLRWRALRQDFERSVPNGWSDTIRAKVTPATWQRMLAAHDQWLADHPQHPAHDMVRLDKVRIHYFSGATDDAWKLLIDLLPRRPVRALAEMRYLLLRSAAPSDTLLDALKDPRLITALAHPSRVTLKRWDRWWKLSQSAPNSDWSKNLQTRLLLVAARAQTAQARQGSASRRPLPKRFPKQIIRRGLAGTLRAAALMGSGKMNAAKAQLNALPPAPQSARLLTRLHYQHGHAFQAARVEGIDPDTRRYFVSVVLTDKQLQQLSRRSPKTLAKQALFERGLRLTERRRWSAGAQLIAPAFPEQASLWRRAAALARRKDAGARLELAALLTEHRRVIFREPDNSWYRGLSARYATSRKATEKRAIAAHFERNSADWRALELLVRWLRDNPQDPHARVVVTLADGRYNRLINRGGGTFFFWSGYANKAATVKQLRALGKTVRLLAGG